jgi:DNA-binding CsgD family transcriptional regulator
MGRTEFATDDAAPAVPLWDIPTHLTERHGSRDIARRLAALVGSIGRDGFDANLTDLLTSAAALDQCNVIRFGEVEDARCLFSWNRVRPGVSSHRVQRYVEGRFFNRDPALESLRRGGPSPQRVALLRREQIEDHWYRSYFYDDAELGGKLSVFEQLPSCGIYMNFYNAAGVSHFSDMEAENLMNVSLVISQSILRHVELMGHPAKPTPHLDAVRRLLAHQAPRLAARESDVCARIVAGYTTEAIALDLGIAASSVATYRKRAYAKLGICSQHELFSLCLAAAREGA